MDNKNNKQQECCEKYAKEAMSWYGWGSPVGLGLMLVAIGIFLWLLKLASIIGR